MWCTWTWVCDFTKRKIIWITNSFDHDNYQFKEMVFNIRQSYILFQIIINFLNNMWCLKISPGPMMFIVSTRLHKVHDNLRCESYDKGIRNILAPLSCSINFIPALFFFFSSSLLKNGFIYLLVFSLHFSSPKFVWGFTIYIACCCFYDDIFSGWKNCFYHFFGINYKLTQLNYY